MAKKKKIQHTEIDKSTDEVAAYADVLCTSKKIKLRGLGHNFDGSYYVKSVSRPIKSGMYTHFTLNRKGIGKKKNINMQQGKVPIDPDLDEQIEISKCSFNRIKEIIAVFEKRLGDKTCENGRDLAMSIIEAWTTIADELSSYQEQIADEEYLQGGKVIYLGVWKREITEVEDEFLKDSALGRADITIRATKRNTRLHSNPNCHDSKRKKKSLQR